MNQFWMVWCPSRNPPVYKHESENNAIHEAERLAKANPGEQFFVLEAVALRVVDNMQRVDLRKEMGDGIPF
jgi:hypothetical protein